MVIGVCQHPIEINGELCGVINYFCIRNNVFVDKELAKETCCAMIVITILDVSCDMMRHKCINERRKPIK